MSAIKVSPLSKQHNFVLPQDKVYSFTFPKGGKMANEDRVSTIITTKVDSTFIITALGYTPEDSENRIDDITGHTADSTTYLSSKGIYDFINAGVVTDSVRVATSITASYATASTIAIFDASKNLVTASTGTYPSLTELSYVKGVTSAVQTQINAKQASHANLTSLSALTYTSRAFVVMNAAGSFSLDANTYLTSNQTITLSGDISGSGSTAISTTIGANKVTNAMLAQVSTATFHGRVTAGTGNVENLTGTQATTLLDTFTSSLKGLAPASGGGTTNFLRADGNWAAPSGGGGTPSGSSTYIQYNSSGSFGASANFVYDFTNNRLGIGVTSPTHKVEVVAGTLTDGQSALYLSATMPTAITATRNAVDWQITSAGSSSFAHRAFNIDYLAGYTGGFNTIALNVTNSIAGTGVGFITSARNSAGSFTSNATTTGTNCGLFGIAGNGNQNVGIVGRTIIAKNSATNVGVYGASLNTGTSPIQIGGFFTLNNAEPSTLTSAALMADNGSQTDPIFVARDNGTIVVQLSDGGFLGIGNGSTAATSQLQINKNQNSVTQADANGILLANSTAAIAGTQSISPPIVWQGNGWSTGSSASQDVRFRQDVLPVQGSNANATWRLAYSLNGAAYSNAFTVDTVGAINFALAAAFSSSVTVSGVLIQSNFRASANNAYQSVQFLVGLADTATQSYRTTNAGSDVNTRLLCVYNNSNSSSGTLGIVADAVNGLMFTAANGTRMIARAAITIGNLTNTAGSEAGDLLFHTQNSGAAYTQKMRISKSGNIVLGNEAALSTSATDGFNYIPSCAGAPSGTPTSYTGMIPSVIDSTNSKIYYYIGGAWKSANLT